MTRKHTIEGVELTLAVEDSLPLRWIGSREVLEQLLASWLVIGEGDVPLNPRVVGKPGVGKTTLGYSVARQLGRPVFIVQCTMDTRPEDLLVTPVLNAEGRVAYHASGLVTAMIVGGVCILDEANRMGEKSWASLAPLLDARRYVESIVAGIKIPAAPDFRICVTMNEDTSTYDVPEYIQSRLKPIIEVGFPSRQEELEILHFAVPLAPDSLLEYVTDFLQKAHRRNLPFTSRDGVHIVRYALKMGRLKEGAPEGFLLEAVEAILGEEGLEFVESGGTDQRVKGAVREVSPEEEMRRFLEGLGAELTEEDQEDDEVFEDGLAGDDDDDEEDGKPPY
ncbi:MAG: AAA family ATPase [Candidatus Sumerlaeia bacterium]|nr:AAA family ATPase [Candidatus Sumerlaeia bacterium]